MTTNTTYSHIPANDDRGHLTDENRAALEKLVNGGAEAGGETHNQASQVLSFDGDTDYSSEELNRSAAAVLKLAVTNQGR